MDLPPPPTLHDAQADLAPKGPWSFLRASMGSGLHGATLGLMAGWAVAELVPAFLLARHVAAHAGNSALPAHWGERLDARELLDLWWNGEWRHQPLPTWGILFLFAGLGWALWSGWKVQAELLDRRPTFRAWGLAGLEALLLGPLPLLVPAWLAIAFLGLIGDRGIDAFAWVKAVLVPLFWLAWSGACFLQWSLLRTAHLLPNRGPWLRHLGHGFLRLWMHPLQWFGLITGAAALRVLLHGGALLLGWRLGGATSLRVWVLVLLQLLATLLGAWIQAVILRIATRFTAHDAAVREARAHLALQATGAPLEA